VPRELFTAILKRIQQFVGVRGWCCANTVSNSIPEAADAKVTLWSGQIGVIHGLGSCFQFGGYGGLVRQNDELRFDNWEMLV